MKSGKWTVDNVEDGLNRYFKEFGRFPTAQEIDKVSYLPSSRQIQRRWGGLEELRRLLGHKDINFGKGVHRSRIAHESNVKGRSGEGSVRKLLCERFHEEFVHIERPIDKNRKLRADFYVYSPEGNFCVDVFSTDTFHDLVTHIGIKSRKYAHYSEKLFFLLISDQLSQCDIDLLIQRKKVPLSSNVSLVTLESFKQIIRIMPSYDFVEQKL
ncbi:MAG: hypothetical protein HGB37_01500 [Candidatus Moranbacteria bacterium]|nr:hypothetical protein [Candidatus Moranbacteria bacterium]